MKTIIKSFCLVLLLTTLWLPVLAPESGDASASVVRASRDGSFEQAPAVSPPDAGRRLRFGRISTDQGLSGNEVWSIAQDRQGFMWFGTSNGLNRYDGYDFKVFKHDPEDPHSLGSDSIRVIFEDRSGALWIATVRGGLNRFDADPGREKGGAIASL